MFFLYSNGSWKGEGKSLEWNYSYTMAAIEKMTYRRLLLVVDKRTEIRVEERDKML